MYVQRDVYRTGRLTVRPQTNQPTAMVITGQQTIQLNNKKPTLLYVPKNYMPQKPAALALMLHGAGGNAAQGLSLIKDFADNSNMILLAPASLEYSWDLIAQDAFGPDVILLDQALDHVFSNYAINAQHLAIGGFSDGASYALSVGLGNGDLFTHILAFSPGFYYTREFAGQPRVFISHGTRDRVLPIDPCSRRIIPRILSQQIEVTYREFDGEHVLPAAIAQDAIKWFLT